MNEKQRWLLRELETWHARRLIAIGRYGPKTVGRPTAAVREAKQMKKQAERVLARWEVDRKKPWMQRKNALQRRYEHVRRIILFDETATALRSLRALK